MPATSVVTSSHRDHYILMRLFSYHIVAILLVTLAHTANSEIFDKDTTAAIGRKIWENEAAGRVDYLTWWNEGESFASLGIGHFIWFPADSDAPFEESFPDLLRFLKENGEPLPSWLATIDPDCPWETREEFFKSFDSRKMRELRHLLQRTFSLQTTFIIQKFKKRWQKILLASQVPEHVAENYRVIIAEPYGPYVLVDYLNFKGAGTNPTERYREQGWGLLQVLEKMNYNGEQPLQDFADAATQVLSDRILNAPAGRDEARWLKGWLKRIETYRY